MPHYCTYIKYNFKYYYGDNDWETQFTNQGLSNSHISYVRAPPVSVGLTNVNEGIYWTMWGAYDLNDELHDDTLYQDDYMVNKVPDLDDKCNNGVGVGSCPKLKNYGKDWEDYNFVDSFECGYDDYSEWHDEWQPADPAARNDNWIQTLNRR